MIRAIYLQLALALLRTNRKWRKEIIHHEGTKNTKRKEFAALQGFGGRLVTLGMHSSWCIARKGAKSQRWLGCELNEVLPGLQGGITVAERFLPSFFFALFVAFVVKHWVAVRGRSRSVRGFVKLVDASAAPHSFTPLVA